MSDSKKEQLGVSHTTAASKLKKMLLFNMVRRLGEDVCFRCGKRIEGADELSIEHKVPWLHSKDPIELFFDLDNIAFSHRKRNRPRPRKSPQITLVCNECGMRFERLERYHRKRMKRGITNTFCSKSCRSKWAYERRDLSKQGRFTPVS